MPKIPASTRAVWRALGALIASVTIVALVFPALSAPAVVHAGDGGWEAKQIRKGDVAKRDRKLAQQLPGRARIGYHPETGRVRFLSGTPAVPLTGGVAKVASGSVALSSADARTKARRFVERYGSMFGLKSPGTEMRVSDTDRNVSSKLGVATVGAGLPNATVRFEQVRGGVPVMGGELVVQLTAAGEVLSAAGEVLPSASAATTRARISKAVARRTAVRWLARLAGGQRSSVRTTSDGLALYDPRLMDDPLLAEGGTRLVWRIDARIPDTASKQGEHRLVLVDALEGDVLTSIGLDREAEGPNRRVCDNRNKPGLAWKCDSPYARSEGQSAVGVSDVNAAYRLMGVTYDYYADLFGRDGIDGQGSRMMATVRYCPSYGCPWRNAEWRWDRQQAIFGKGWAKADDIVAHEFTHGVLDAEAPLFYHYQSGAINESYADVFGEFIDLSYAGGKDTSAVKWRIGEDTPVGAFRSMKNPPLYGHPDRVRSPKWYAGTGDYGGVHINNGVGNKAAYLMAAGGTFQGYRIAGIGRTRTARIWYHALTTRLTPAANYLDLADALRSSCTDLAGTQGITLAHCKSVSDAVKATQMNKVPKSQAPAQAPVCTNGTSPIDVFNDDLEDLDSGLWSRSRLAGDKRAWYYPQNPNHSSTWDGTWASSGKYNFYAPDRGSRSDGVMQLREAVTLPEGAFLRFEHGYSFDKDSKRRYDGAIVQIQVDGGSWRGVKSYFTHGGYNGRIAWKYGNPLAGKRAFTGNSHGWSESRVDLSAFAGSEVKVRFRMASDRSISARGWYIDDVRIYACANDGDRPTGTLAIDAGAETTADSKVTLSLTWADATTWVTRIRLSGRSAMGSSGKKLLYGVSMDPRGTVEWDLSDRSYGGSGEPGTRTVFAQVRDAAGNWSEVLSDQIEWLEP